MPKSSIRLVVLQTAGGFSKNGEAGGGVVHGVRLMEEWQKLGCDVRLITNELDFGEEQYRELKRISRIPAYHLDHLKGVSEFALESLLNHFVQWPELRRLLRGLDTASSTTIVISMSPYTSDVIAVARARRLLSIPGVVYFHHINEPPWWQLGRRGSLLRTTFNWTMSMTSLALSKIFSILPALDQPRTLSLAGWSLPYVPLKDEDFLVDLDQIPSAPKDGIRKQFAACFISRVTPGKGAVDLVRSWSLVTRDFPAATLVIADSSDSSPHLIGLGRLASKLGVLEKIQFRRVRGPRDRRELLCASELFVFPSYEEGWSMSVMEAAALGTVPVTYDLPAYDYLGPEAVKVPVGDVRALSQTIVRLLRDPQARARISETTRLAALSFRREEVARRQLEFLIDWARQSRG